MFRRVAFWFLFPICAWGGQTLSPDPLWSCGASDWVGKPVISPDLLHGTRRGSCVVDASSIKGKIAVLPIDNRAKRSRYLRSSSLTYQIRRTENDGVEVVFYEEVEVTRPWFAPSFLFEKIAANVAHRTLEEDRESFLKGMLLASTR